MCFPAPGTSLAPTQTAKHLCPSLPLPVAVLPVSCPRQRPWAPPGSCEEGFNLLRGSGARQGGCCTPTPWALQCSHCLGLGGPGGGHGTPCSPQIPLCPQELSRRDEPSLVLGLCRSCERSGWLWRGPHSFPGGFWAPGAGILASPCTVPSPSFPFPLPAVARWFGSLGLTRVWETKAAQPGSLWPHCPRAP